MKLKDFLKEAYKQQPLEDDVEESIQHAYKYLSSLGDKNKTLQTTDFLSYPNERENILTGEEIIAQGIYLLYTDAHEGSEILVEQEDYESALVKQKEWNSIEFNPYDYCSLVVVN